MRIIICGETSGRIREALRSRGHDSWSCDFLPSQVPGQHIVGNAFDHLRDGWDMMIAHPTCTKLTVAAAWCFYHPDDRALPFEERRPHPKFPQRRAEQDEAVEDFMRFAHAPIPKKVVENPVGIMATRYRPADQHIQPNWFGDDASKLTGLWLFGVRKLRIPPPELWHPGRWVVDPRSGKTVQRWANQTDSGQNREPPSAERWSIRSETYPGIARAFAENWG